MQKVTLWKKIHVIYSFFLVRKIIAHIVTFVFYCIVIPATVLVPEVEIPKWGSVYIPTIITLLNAVGTPRYPSSQEVWDPRVGVIKINICLNFWRYKKSNICLNTNSKIIDWCRSVHLIVFWVLFENVMSLHRTKATFIGLLEAGRVNEWVVTEKLGDALRMKMPGKGSKKPLMRIGDRYVTKFCPFWFIFPFSRLSISVESGCISWSLVSQHTSSSVDATTPHLGITTTTYSSFSNLLLSSSLVWAMSGHLSRIHRRSAVTPSSWIHDCVNLFTALWYYKSSARALQDKP